MAESEFEYKGVVATPLFVTVPTQQAGGIKKLSGWRLLKDDEQLVSPSHLRTVDEVKGWIDEFVNGN